MHAKQLETIIVHTAKRNLQLSLCNKAVHAKQLTNHGTHDKERTSTVTVLQYSARKSSWRQIWFTRQREESNCHCVTKQCTQNSWRQLWYTPQRENLNCHYIAKQCTHKSIGDSYSRHPSGQYCRAIVFNLLLMYNMIHRQYCTQLCTSVHANPSALSTVHPDHDHKHQSVLYQAFLQSTMQ